MLRDYRYLLLRLRDPCTEDKYVRCFQLAVSYYFFIGDVSYQELIHFWRRLESVFIPGFGEVPASDFLLIRDFDALYVRSVRPKGAITGFAMSELANWVLGNPTDPRHRC